VPGAFRVSRLLPYGQETRRIPFGPANGLNSCIGSLVQSEAVIHRFLQILPRSQVAFGRLDGCVAQQELDLLEVPAGFAA